MDFVPNGKSLGLGLRPDVLMGAILGMSTGKTQCYLVAKGNGTMPRPVLQTSALSQGVPRHNVSITEHGRRLGRVKLLHRHSVWPGWRALPGGHASQVGKGWAHRARQEEGSVARWTSPCCGSRMTTAQCACPNPWNL
jgi:hypothetical protein